MAEKFGLGKCKVCGATVEYTGWGATKVKADCNGNHDSKACGSRVILGVTHSENIKRELKGAQNEPIEPKSTGTGPERTEGTETRAGFF